MSKTYILSFLLFCLLSQPLAGALVQKVEPLFWWTEMQQPEMQLMLYGKDIASAKITVKYPGIKIVRTSLTYNPNYVFLYLKISKRTKPGKFDLLIQKGEEVQRYPYELKQRETNSRQRESFTEADAVYLLMPDRFVNGNSANDSIPGYHQGVDRSDLGKRHGGDIEGVISKIPYLADLGITALWTTPFFDNNDRNYSYHHYACTDYYKIDPRLGTNEDYPRLTEEAKKYGIKLILDVVPNHCGIGHWWLKDMPAKDWFNQWETFTSSNYRMMSWTDPHAAQTDLHRLTHGWFSPNMPDLNLQHPLLFDYLKQVYIFWIEYAGIAGLRVDTYPYNDIHTASRFIRAIRDEYPKMNIVGECWMNTAQEIAYYQSGNNNKDGFDSNLTSVMDFPLNVVFRDAFSETEGWNQGMARFYMHFALDFAYPNTNLLMNFIDNHDVDRYAAVINGDVDKYKMALAMLVTTRGYPQIYYGTEIMLDGIKGSYEGHRFDFPGGFPEDDRIAFDRNGRTEKENEVFDYLQTLLQYRKSHSVLQNGKMKQFIPENGIYVYFRYNDEEKVMVVVNNDDDQQIVPLKRFDEMLKGKQTGMNIITKEQVLLKETIMISGKTVLVIAL
ncbi:MAG: glycoside hydrolase family 13 protein [Paludibacter sp.]|nr:glycoside hydrolase family 13 protein [Paludibacter sp.]